MSVEISDVGGVDGPSVSSTACFVAGVEEPSDNMLALRGKVSLTYDAYEVIDTDLKSL